MLVFSSNLTHNYIQERRVTHGPLSVSVFRVTSIGFDWLEPTSEDGSSNSHARVEIAHDLIEVHFNKKNR